MPRDRCIRVSNRVCLLRGLFVTLLFVTVSCTISRRGPRFACFLYDFVPNLAVVECVWYDFVLRCHFPVRFRTNGLCFNCFRSYFVEKVVRFRNDVAVCLVSGTIDAPVPSQIYSI